MTNNTIGEKIKLTRDYLKLSHSKFATLIGIKGKNTVSLWENGKKIPPKSRLRKISEVSNLPLDWFLKDTEIKLFNPAFNDDFIIHDEDAEAENLKEENTIGKRIKNLRKRKKLLQSQLASKLDLKSVGTVGRWECGKRTPTDANLEKMAKLFNVSALWLKNGIGSEKDKDTALNTAKVETVLTEKSKIIIKKDIKEMKPEKHSVIVLTEDLTSEEKYLLTLFKMLSPVQRGRLLGYGDGLHREQLFE
ncbi:MAG: helix-turn-helix domain-containing protein [Oscillospiraceae bacterium]|nr:helix-turn-helix domain-containing protein [Oscillospiraceae bacterium]